MRSWRSFCNQQATFQKSPAPFLRMSQRRRLRSSLRGPAPSSSYSAAATRPATKSASTSQALLPPANLDKLNILSFSSFKDLKVSFIISVISIFHAALNSAGETALDRFQTREGFYNVQTPHLFTLDLQIFVILEKHNWTSHLLALK